MRQLGSIFIVACFAAAVYCGYRAVDSVAGIFDGRSDVAITEIETGGRVQIAEIQADRDVQIATIHTHRDVVETVTSTCSLYSVFRSTFSDAVDPRVVGAQQAAM